MAVCIRSLIGSAFWGDSPVGQEGFHRLQFSGLGRMPLLWKSMVFVASKPAAALARGGLSGE
jgi:hypothetical protein